MHATHCGCISFRIVAICSHIMSIEWCGLSYVGLRKLAVFEIVVPVRASRDSPNAVPFPVSQESIHRSHVLVCVSVCVCVCVSVCMCVSLSLSLSLSLSRCSVCFRARTGYRNHHNAAFICMECGASKRGATCYHDLRSTAS